MKTILCGVVFFLAAIFVSGCKEDEPAKPAPAPAAAANQEWSLIKNHKQSVPDVITFDKAPKSKGEKK